MTIAFNQIPVDLRTPQQTIEFDSSKAISGLPAAQQKILVIGQRLAAGTVAALTPTRIVSAAQAVKAFGRASLLAGMCASLFAVNGSTEVWAIALDDIGGGTLASGTLTFTGPATASGTVALMLAGRRVPVGVTSGDTATAVAAAAVAAINADLDMPLTAAAAAGVVTVTARNKGTAPNDIDLRHSYYQGEALPAGIALAIVAMSGGATNPDVSTVWPVLGDAHYQTIVLPFADGATLTSAELELTSRWSPQRQIEAMAYAAVRGSFSAVTTLGASRNSPYVSIVGARNSPSPPWAWAAAWAGEIALEGSIDPARPFQTLQLPGLVPPLQGDRFIRQERELLLKSGISTFTVDGGVVLIERPITTYQTNVWGLADVAWLDVNTPLTLAYLRYAVRQRISSKYPRHKLANDGTNFGAGQAIVTPKIIRAELIALFRDLEAAGLVEDLDQFIADLIVERDATDLNRVNALIPPNIVNQFRVFAGRIEFRL